MSEIKVTCEGFTVGSFEDRQEAEDFAEVWNHAYPDPEFIVEDDEAAS